MLKIGQKIAYEIKAYSREHSVLRGKRPDHGRRLREDWGTVPPKFEVRGRPMHPSPNILRSTVIGCEAKYELTKKRCQGGIFLSGIEVCGQEKGVMYVIYQISDKNRVDD